MSKKVIAIKLVVPLVIVAAGVVGMRHLVLSKEPPRKMHRSNPGALVETLAVQREVRPVFVTATGTVQPRMTVEVIPQVGGRVLRVAEGFAAGGFFSKGDLLFEIEAVDYELALEKSRSALARAEYELAQVESQARVARAEWAQIRLEKKGKPNPLVLYEPQLKNARAALASARADVKQRQLDIRRTRIHAPFNCRIQSETVDPGQFVTAGKGVASLTGTDAAEIIVPVPLRDLKWLSIPRPGSDIRKASTASVRIDVNGETLEWPGQVDRSLGEVDPKGRMARLVVSVDDPYGLKQTPGNRRHVDLADGLFVDVVLAGSRLKDVVPIPAAALRENSSVWVMTPERILDIRPVDVVRRERNVVLTRGGLESGDRLILTRLTGAAPGMKLRPAEEG